MRISSNNVNLTSFLFPYVVFPFSENDLKGITVFVPELRARVPVTVYVNFSPLSCLRAMLMNFKDVTGLER